MKKLLGIVVLGLLWCSNSFSQNCDPNQYNDGMMVKEYEAEYNYKAEEAYNFGKKIQNILLQKDLRGFINLTKGDLRTSLEQKYKENKSFENFFDDEQYKKIVGGEVYCFPLGPTETLQFKLGDDWNLTYTLQNENWVILKYR
jgi:hypothetical protein